MQTTSVRRWRPRSPPPSTVGTQPRWLCIFLSEPTTEGRALHEPWMTFEYLLVIYDSLGLWQVIFLAPFFAPPWHRRAVSNASYPTKYCTSRASSTGSRTTCLGNGTSTTTSLAWCSLKTRPRNSLIHCLDAVADVLMCQSNIIFRRWP